LKPTNKDPKNGEDEKSKPTSIQKAQDDAKRRIFRGSTYAYPDFHVDKKGQEGQPDNSDPERLEKALKISNPMSFSWRALSDKLNKISPFSSKPPWEEPDKILYSPEGRPYHKEIDRLYLESCPWARPYLDIPEGASLPLPGSIPDPRPRSAPFELFPRHALKEYILEDIRFSESMSLSMARYLCPTPSQPFFKHTLKEYMLMGEVKSMLDLDQEHTLDDKAKTAIIDRVIARKDEVGKEGMKLGDIVSDEVQNYLRSRNAR